MIRACGGRVFTVRKHAIRLFRLTFLLMASPIPVIDLASAKPGELTDALIRSSCAFVVGHGVDPQLHERMIEVSRAFFDLPLEDKAAVRWPGDGQWRGWLPVFEGGRDLNGDGPPELLEKFEIQLPHPWPHSDEALLSEWGEGFDSWPAAPSELRSLWSAYYQEMGYLACRIVTMIAEALDLPVEALDDWRDRHFANLVVNNYFGQQEAPAPGQLRAKAHTDIGGLTVLWADDAPGGLEVRQPGVSGWTPVVVPPGAYLIQVGDLLARWTNDLIKANIHRVANPPAESGEQSRRTSLVYFHYPNLDVTVTPAPSCISDDTPAGSAIAAGGHLRNAVQRPKVRHDQLAAALGES
jgi:isopenicillin N synthase-like dioxygenase